MTEIRRIFALEQKNTDYKETGGFWGWQKYILIGIKITEAYTFVKAQWSAFNMYIAFYVNFT